MDKEKILSKIKEATLYVIVDEQGRFLNSGMKGKKEFNEKFEDARIYTKLSTVRTNISTRKVNLYPIKINITDLEIVDDSKHKEKAEREKKKRKIQDEIRMYKNSLARSISRKNSMTEIKQLDQEITKYTRKIQELTELLKQI